jgi:hypothetical protein
MGSELWCEPAIIRTANDIRFDAPFSGQTGIDIGRFFLISEKTHGRNSFGLYQVTGTYRLGLTTLIIQVTTVPVCHLKRVVQTLGRPTPSCTRDSLALGGLVVFSGVKRCENDNRTKGFRG